MSVMTESELREPRVHEPVPTRAGIPVQVQLFRRDCDCGQALDHWRRGHCPRCGATLR
jgi:hypothetical protein